MGACMITRKNNMSNDSIHILTATSGKHITKTATRDRKVYVVADSGEYLSVNGEQQWKYVITISDVALDGIQLRYYILNLKKGDVIDCYNVGNYGFAIIYCGDEEF